MNNLKGGIATEKMEQIVQPDFSLQNAK